MPEPHEARALSRELPFTAVGRQLTPTLTAEILPPDSLSLILLSRFRLSGWNMTKEGAGWSRRATSLDRSPTIIYVGRWYVTPPDSVFLTPPQPPPSDVGHKTPGKAQTRIFWWRQY